MMQKLVCWDHPDRPALITETGSVIAYGQLHAAVQNFGQKLEIQKLVFLLGKNDLPTLTAYLACLEFGAIPLLLDPDASDESRAQLFNIYDPAYIFQPSNSAAAIDDAVSVAEIDGYALYRREGASKAEVSADLALLLATSGSTGSPKLVRLSLHNLLSNARSIMAYLGIASTERAITSLPFNYSYGLSVINSHLAAGASLVLSTRSFFDAEFWQQVKVHQVTSLAGVPYSYDMLLKLRFERMDLPSVRTLTQAGGKMSPAQTQRVLDICKSKGIRFFPMYGQTEASPRMAYLSPEDLAHKLGSIGHPIPGGRMWIEDEHGQVVSKPNQVGELVYSGPNVAMGYAERREDLSRGDDWHGVLRTGDLARQDADGFFFIEGRARRFLKIFGVRVSLDAVEAWFARRGLVAAAHGHDDQLRVAIQADIPSVGHDSAQALAAEMGIHPTAIKVSVLAQLPRFGSGKVDYPFLNAMP